MKKALLWLCPLACLALASLHVYAWSTRDPLVVAFERIEEGDTLQEAIDTIGRAPNYSEYTVMQLPDERVTKVLCTGWSRARFTIWVLSEDGRVVSKEIWCHDESFVEKAWSRVRSFWEPTLVPVSVAPPPSPSVE